MIRQQRSQLRRSLKGLKREGLSPVFVLETPEEVEAATIERMPLWNDKRTSTARSTSSATCMAAATNWKSCCAKLGYEPRPLETPGPGWSNLCYAASGRPQGGIRRRPGRPRAAGPRCAEHRAKHGRSWRGAVRARQPRHEAAAEASRQGRADHPRPGPNAGRDRRDSRTTERDRFHANWRRSSTAW